MVKKIRSKRRLWYAGVATLLGSGVMLGSVLGCGSSNNSQTQPDNPNNYVYTIYIDGVPHNVKYSVFIAYLKAHPGANTSNQVQYDNQIIKYLYNKEQAASVTDHNKDDTIPKLTTVKDIYSDAQKKLDARKKEIQSEYGTNWQQQWDRALLSTEYGGSTSEKQAVEYFAVQTMHDNALLRFTTKIDTTKYKANQIGDSDYPFLKSDNAIPDAKSDKAITLITSSYDDYSKHPGFLLKSYMQTYKSAWTVRHILYALKGGITKASNWSFSKTSLEKLFHSTTVTDNVWQALPVLNNSNTNWVGDGALAANIAQFSSDDAAAAKANASLGMSSVFDTLNTMVGGFAIPLAYIMGHKVLPSKVPTLSPSPVTWNLYDINKKLGIGDKDGHITDKSQIDNMTDQQVTNYANMMRDQLLTNTDGEKPLLGSLSIGNPPSKTNANESQLCVFSKDGFHMVYPQEQTYTDTPMGGLESWVHSDLEKTKQANPLVYNVSKAVNAKFAPTTSNLNWAVNYVQTSHPVGDNKTVGGADFTKYLKTQTNYTTQKDFTDQDVASALKITQTLRQVQNDENSNKLVNKLQTWWDGNVLKKLVDPQTVTFPALSLIIRELGNREY